MNFTISCEAYVRLSVFALSADIPDVDPYFGSVYIEHKAGNVIAVGASRKVCAVEYLGKTTEGDGFVNICVNRALADQCAKETPFASVINILHIPAIALATIKTTFGYEHPGNAIVTGERNWLAEWRSAMPAAVPKKTNGSLRANAEYLKQLAASAPSKLVVFPEHIDVNQPVVLRDAIDPNWMGMLMPTLSDNHVGPKIMTATIPEWCKS